MTTRALWRSQDQSYHSWNFSPHCPGQQHRLEVQHLGASCNQIDMMIHPPLALGFSRANRE